MREAKEEVANERRAGVERSSSKRLNEATREKRKDSSSSERGPASAE